MPWIAVVCLCLVGACRFDADYRGGTYHCSDGKCPSGLTCGADEVCREAGTDAAIDMPVDTMVMDAPPNELSCADPQPFPATGGSTVNTTVGKLNKLMPTCNGSMMFAPDAVYKIDPGAAGKQMLVKITPTNASFAVVAYVTTTCPSTTCLTNTYAYANNSIIITTLAGPHYIVVDSALSGQTGEYTLMVSVQ